MMPSDKTKNNIKRLLLNLLGVTGLFFCLGLIVFVDERIQYFKYPDARLFHSRLSDATRLGRQSMFLPDLTPFIWEKACFIGPYVSVKEIREAIGSEYILEPIDNMDDKDYYLIFALPNKHTVPVRISRAFFRLNYGDQYTPYCFTFEEMKTMPLELEKD